MVRYIVIVVLACINLQLICQNPLYIPPAITGIEFNLEVKNGSVEFFPGITTPTYGINANVLAPTLILNKWDWITMHVTNNLTGSGASTTLHWHGLHVPASADGGPHQLIEQGDTWSPSFQILNNAGTFWYHPHGAGKTDLQVSRGLSGLIIVKDSAEALLNLPHNYGIDDFPLIVQTKAFDILYQIAISTNDDTTICVNATRNAYLDAPAQVVRLRLLNASSMRVFNFGLSDDKTFSLIATDGGLLENSVNMSRILLGPGERAEILADLQGMEGQTIYLKSFSSEMPDNIYGASIVNGGVGGEIPGYDLNPLNGADFNILQLNIIEQTDDPVTEIPEALVENTPLVDYDTVRNFILQADDISDPDAQVEGPFNINGEHFNMDLINETVQINAKEKWHITNNTGIAHPFHIHDVQFTIDNINGDTVPAYLQGRKDVILVPPMQFAEVVMQFTDFADNEIPYMYHCHMLHHEDDGMMGSFKVVDTTLSIPEEASDALYLVYPNPASDYIFIRLPKYMVIDGIKLLNAIGDVVKVGNNIDGNNLSLSIVEIPDGIYTMQIIVNNTVYSRKIIKI